MARRRRVAVPDPYGPARRERRFWQLYEMWNLTPWWRVEARDRPVMWQVFWFRVATTSAAIAMVVLLVLLANPIVHAWQAVTRLVGMPVGRSAEPYLVLSTVLTIVTPIAIVLLTWYLVRRHIRRRRGLDI
ncbi:MAG: hypothetical protein ABFE08_06975 [Armatimonadia bacterium]